LCLTGSGALGVYILLAGSTIFHMLNNVNPLNTQAIVMFNIR